MPSRVWIGEPFDNDIALRWHKLDVWIGMPNGFTGSIGKLKAVAQALDSVGVFLSTRLGAREPGKPKLK